MTLDQAIRNFDIRRENDIRRDLKVFWINELDAKIYSELLEQRTEDGFEGYDVTTPFDTELLAPAAFAEIYSLYLAMKLDIMNGEIGRSNNSALLFNRRYYEMSSYICRKQRVKRKIGLKAGALDVSAAT